LSETTVDHHGHQEHGHHDYKPHWSDWLFTTDAKKIGFIYIIMSFIYFIVGGVLAGMIRIQLATPTMNFVDGVTYNGIVSMHGTIMIFMWVMPFIAGIINFVMPLQIGARDMAFPRLNAMGLWLFNAGALVLLATFLLGMPQAGWTSYAPLSTLDKKEIGMDLWILGIQLLGVSSIMSGLNFVVTVVKLRAPGMTWFRMPLFVWSSLVVGWLMILAMPAIAVTLLEVFLERHFGFTFFGPAHGGDPILYQHLFWFFGHPEVYILIMPAFGIISEIIPVFSRKPVFGYKLMAWSMILIAFLSFLLWAHHMFSSGMDPRLSLPFMILTMIIGVPTGVKMFNWMATMWRGKLYLDSPMIFSVGFLITFAVGGFGGIILASIPIDLHITNTYFVVGHMHYVLFGGSVMAIFAAIYFWFPKMTGYKLNEKLAMWHFGFTFIGSNVTFLPMHWLGMLGMPRRVLTYDVLYANDNLMASIGGAIMGFGTIFLVVNYFLTIRKKERCAENPWNSKGLEWTHASSPPAANNFDEIPVVTTDPYDYGVLTPPKAAKEAKAHG